MGATSCTLVRSDWTARKEARTVGDEAARGRGEDRS